MYKGIIHKLSNHHLCTILNLHPTFDVPTPFRDVWLPLNIFSCNNVAKNGTSIQARVPKLN